MGLWSVQVPVVVAQLVGTFGTLWAALITAGLRGGRAGIRALLSRLVRWRVGARWYLLARFFSAAYLLGGSVLAGVLSGPPTSLPIAALPVERALLSFVSSLLVFVFLNTEEFAWRGFALPILQSRHSALVAGLLKVFGPAHLAEQPVSEQATADIAHTAR